MLLVLLMLLLLGLMLSLQQRRLGRQPPPRRHTPDRRLVSTHASPGAQDPSGSSSARPSSEAGRLRAAAGWAGQQQQQQRRRSGSSAQRRRRRSTTPGAAPAHEHRLCGLAAVLLVAGRLIGVVFAVGRQRARAGWLLSALLLVHAAALFIQVLVDGVHRLAEALVLQKLQHAPQLRDKRLVHPDISCSTLVAVRCQLRCASWRGLLW